MLRSVDMAMRKPRHCDVDCRDYREFPWVGQPRLASGGRGGVRVHPRASEFGPGNGAPEWMDGSSLSPTLRLLYRWMADGPA